MLTIQRSSIFQTLKLNSLTKEFKNNVNTYNFYSDFDGNVISNIIRGNVYIIQEGKNLNGLIINNKFKKSFNYIPLTSSISINKLLLILSNNFNASGYKLPLNYKKINIDNLKKYFPIHINDNMLYMKIDNCINKNDVSENPMLLVRNLEINKEEDIRVELQNKIFDNVANRTLLTREEVLNEINHPRFLKEFCFVLEVYREPAGYGQILKFGEKYFLVNFGVLPEYRNKGYGRYFLSSILRECKRAGIKEVYLSVDKKNESAINLYNNIGFVELYNLVTIIFK